MTPIPSAQRQEFPSAGRWDHHEFPRDRYGGCGGVRRRAPARRFRRTHESPDFVPVHAKSAHAKSDVDGLSDAPSEKGSAGALGTASRGSSERRSGVGLLSDTGRPREAGEVGEVAGFGAVVTGPGAAGSTPRTVAHCGLNSPECVEAQTCVMTDGRDTWARSSCRNTTGGELRSVLTLMRPGGGRTVEVRCTVDAQEEPGVCQTSRRSSRGGPDAYTAVAEYVGEGAVAEAPLLLRAGSSPASPAAG
jgi:hypothetical protein